MAWTYSRAVAYVKENAVSRPGLERINALLRALGMPQERFLRVHVAGTNGKGSTAAYIAAALNAAGHKTGLFSSPAVCDRRECICLGGEPIGELEYAYCMERVARAAQALPQRPTAFEAETAAAYLYFALKGCRVAVLEAGMGGEWDATNAEGAKAAVALTSVGLDHTAFLGGSAEEIARTKAALASRGETLFCQRQTPGCEEAIKDVARRRGAACVFVPPLESGADEDGQWVLAFGRKTRVMLGTRQADNAALAAAVCTHLGKVGLLVPPSAFCAGVAGVRLPGRQELVGKDLMLDGAHNPQAARELGKSLDLYFPGRPKTALIGVFADKDVEGVLAGVLPHVSAAVTFDWDDPRASSGEKLQAAAEKYCKAYYLPDIRQAAALAKKLSGTDGLTVGCGSFSHLQEIRKVWSEV